LSSVSKKPIRGRGARDKGSRAERKVRDILRRIYPPEKRDRVYRIPLSGGGAIKGDVADNNDYDSCYEVKNQEALKLNEWWRQAKNQAGGSRTPVLVVTQAFRPFYFILRASDWLPVLDKTEYRSFQNLCKVGTGTTFFDDMAKLEERDLGHIFLDDDECVVIPEQYYVDVKTCIYEQSSL
jgi:hypothetical protein